MNISHLTYIIAEKSETVSALTNKNEIPANDGPILEKIMGLRSIPRDNDINHVTQLNRVVEKLLDEYPIDPSTVKYVLFAHTADYVAPCGVDILSEIVKKNGFKSALCFGSTLYKCAGAFHLMQLAELLFKDLGDENYILLLVGDLAFTSILKYIPGSTILGDSATGVLLQKSGAHNYFIDAVIEMYGEFAKGIWCNSDEQLLFQSAYVNYLCEIIMRILHKNNMTLSQIKHIFPHNVNKISWKQVIQTLSLSSHQVCLDNVSRTAHCFGSDPFINLKDAIVKNILEKNDYYLMVTMGLGATFSVMLFRY